MATELTATISKVEKHRFSSECALVTFSLSGVFTPPTPPDPPNPPTPGAKLTVDPTPQFYPEQRYQFPLPAQDLYDGTHIDACPAFDVPGEPDEVELEIGLMVIARYWMAQLGMPSAESDIKLTVVAK